MVVLKRAAAAAVSAGLLVLSGPATAHVSAEPGAATAGAYQVVRFRVGHGCSDVRATTALRIEMPDAMPSARPQPKPGWTLSIEHAGGRPEGAVTAIVWRGRLPADQFDEFAVMFHLPAAAGTLYFPTVQTCGAEEAQWTEIPEAGESGLSHPAPSLKLTAPGSPAGAPEARHDH